MGIDFACHRVNFCALGGAVRSAICPAAIIKPSRIASITPIRVRGDGPAVAARPSALAATRRVTEMRQQLSITLQGLEGQNIYVESMRGREAVSEPYEFVVDVVSSQAVDLENILGKAAKFELDVDDEEMVVNGVISVAAALDPTHLRDASRQDSREDFCYSFTIVPELALLKLTGQNNVYGTETAATVVDIISKELADANKAGSKTAGSRTIRNIQSEILAEAGDYPALDFVMQYRESDFNFVNRMCERFGIFYSFDTGGNKETVYFCDRKEHFRKLSGRNLTSELSYHAEMQIDSRGDFAIHSFRSQYSVQTGTVQLREYNDETPNVDLSISQDAQFESFGVRVDYGENYRTPAEGRLIAQKRTELLETQRLEYHGKSNIPLLRPGLFFKLMDHPDSAFEKLYVITEVEHAVTEATPLGFSSGEKKISPYQNRFTCIPFDTQYRPRLKTPRPFVHGFLIAIVDGENDTGRAELDKYGRYRVRIRDEESGFDSGRASHFVRKLEPYGGGDGYGSHSTLLIGTEVMLGFLNGDPDRPVIMGAFSNAEQSNTVTNVNHNVAHRTRTASGMVMQMSDGIP